MTFVIDVWSSCKLGNRDTIQVAGRQNQHLILPILATIECVGNAANVRARGLGLVVFRHGHERDAGHDDKAPWLLKSDVVRGPIDPPLLADDVLSLYIDDLRVGGPATVCGLHRLHLHPREHVVGLLHDKVIVKDAVLVARGIAKREALLDAKLAEAAFGIGAHARGGLGGKRPTAAHYLNQRKLALDKGRKARAAHVVAVDRGIAESCASSANSARRHDVEV